MGYTGGTLKTEKFGDLESNLCLKHGFLFTV